MRGARPAAVMALALTVGACGVRSDVLGVRLGGACPVPARPLSTWAVAEEQANVHLFVSNQSFEDPVVRLVLSVDGERVVDQDLDVCGQHDWPSFPLRLEPGWHDVVATTPTGIRTATRVEVPGAREARWVVVSYWTDPEPRVDVDVREEPVGFA